MIFGFLPQNLKTKAVAVAFSIAWLEAGVEPQREEARAREVLAGFRRELYRCFTARADALFELADAVLCADGPVRMLAGLSLAPEHRRGHGALYRSLSTLRPGSLPSRPDPATPARNAIRRIWSQAPRPALPAGPVVPFQEPLLRPRHRRSAARCLAPARARAGRIGCGRARSRDSRPGTAGQAASWAASLRGHIHLLTACGFENSIAAIGPCPAWPASHFA
jgi:hypothetical protein